MGGAVAALTGSSGIRISRFLVYEVASALLWARNPTADVALSRA